MFDFLMVLAGYTTFIPASSSSSASSASAVRALRALRALRPLRTITRFESLRSIVVCFLEVRKRKWGLQRGGLESMNGKGSSCRSTRDERAHVYGLAGCSD